MVALGLWWNGNTVSHNFVHNPFFRSRTLNRLFSGVLSLLLGFPQGIWRQAHLAHHAERRVQVRWTAGVIAETALVAAGAVTLGVVAPRFLAFVYAPGWLAGMALCALQGRLEHRGGAVVGHDSRLYNALLFNDGLHPEHHAHPGAHWSELPRVPRESARRSRWPAVLRWVEMLRPLDGLERVARRCRPLRAWVLARHRAALARLALAPPRTAVVVGGGILPRSAILLRERFPDAALTVLDREPAHLALAAPDLPEAVATRVETYDPAQPPDVDLVVIPLSFAGDRRTAYAHPPPHGALLVHDWIWRRRGTGTVVSWWLLKRMNVVRR